MFKKKVAAIDLLLLLDVESYAAATGRWFATFRGKKTHNPNHSANQIVIVTYITFI